MWGDDSVARDLLQNVQNQLPTAGYGPTVAAGVQKNAILTEGGSDSSAAREKLENVQQVQSSGGAFAAVLGALAPGFDGANTYFLKWAGVWRRSPQPIFFSKNYETSI